MEQETSRVSDISWGFQENRDVDDSLYFVQMAAFGHFTIRDTEEQTSGCRQLVAWGSSPCYSRPLLQLPTWKWWRKKDGAGRKDSRDPVDV